MATVIDTLEFARELQAAQLGKEQAEGVARALPKTRAADLAPLATRDDLERLRLATATDIERSRLQLEARLAETKADLLKWMIPLLGGQLVALIALAVGFWVRA